MCILWFTFQITSSLPSSFTSSLPSSFTCSLSLFTSSISSSFTSSLSSFTQANSVADKNKALLPLGLSEAPNKEEEDQELEEEDSPEEMDHNSDSEGEGDVRMELAIDDFILEVSSDNEDSYGFGEDDSIPT